MSNARNLADVISGNFDVPLGALDNVPPSNDASALTTGTLGHLRLPTGAIVGAASAHDSTPYTTTSSNRYTAVSLNYTAKYSSGDSDIIMFGVIAHGLGPRGLNLDGYGLTTGFVWNGSTEGIGQYADVFAGSGDGVSYGPEWDIRTFAFNQRSTRTWSAGETIAIGSYADNDGTAGIFINRCYATTSSRGTCSITVIEVKK